MSVTLQLAALLTEVDLDLLWKFAVNFGIKGACQSSGSRVA